MYEKLKAFIIDEFWPVTNLNQLNVLFNFFFKKSKISNIIQWKTQHLILTITQQKQYNNARKYYVENRKKYVRQNNAMKEIKRYIKKKTKFSNKFISEKMITKFKKFN